MFALLRTFFGASPSVSGLDEVRQLSWRQFEWVVREGFRRRGFTQVSTPSADAVDVALQVGSDTLLVQCKQWKASAVSMKLLRELAEAIVTCDAAGGFFVTAGSVSAEARDFAKHAGIELIDGSALEALFLDARRPEPFMDPTESRRRTSFRKPEQEPSCPLCGGAMEKKIVMGGAHKGTHFWSCLQSPQCRGKLDL